MGLKVQRGIYEYCQMFHVLIQMTREVTQHTATISSGQFCNVLFFYMKFPHGLVICA